MGTTLESITLQCRPGAQFHFGKIALDADTSLNDTSHTMHSDALASAFVETAFRVFAQTTAETVLADFEKGTVRVSSLMWLLDLGNGRQVHFLPKPVSLDTAPGGNEDDRKDILRVRYISKKVWEQGIEPREWSSRCVILQKEFVLTLEEISGIYAEKWDKMRLYDVVSLPKVAVHKLTRENSLYFQTNVQVSNFADIGLPLLKAHFYFLLESEDSKARDRVVNLAHILADEGIGGERSVGCGKLEGCDESAPFSIAPTATNEKLFCTTSLVSPTSQEEFEKCRAWKIITRGGRRTAEDGTLKRQKMLAEGVLLATRIGGRSHVISEENAQYAYRRFGAALCLPAHDHHQQKSAP